jgi:hypothetical protein
VDIEDKGVANCDILGDEDKADVVIHDGNQDRLGRLKRISLSGGYGKVAPFFVGFAE